jgi:hypothetical protein
VAEACDRVIRVRDGKIREAVPPTVPVEVVPPREAVPAPSPEATPPLVEVG